MCILTSLLKSPKQKENVKSHQVEAGNTYSVMTEFSTEVKKGKTMDNTPNTARKPLPT